MTVETAQGAFLEVNNAGSWVEVGELESFDGLIRKQTIIDATNLRSTARRRKSAKLLDCGPFTGQLAWDPNDAGQIRVRALLTSGATENYRVTLADTNTTQAVFAGIVEQFKVAGKIGDKLMADLSIAIDGAPTGL